MAKETLVRARVPRGAFVLPLFMLTAGALAVALLWRALVLHS